MPHLTTILTATVLAAASLTATAQTSEFIIRADKPGAAIQPTMYGIFFEDINYAADGGLYAELIANRSFEFANPFACWNVSGRVTLLDDGPFERNPHYVRLAPTGHREKPTMIENEGFFGIGVKADAAYRFSLWARCPEGGSATLRAELVDLAATHESGASTIAVRDMEEAQGRGTADVTVAGREWKRYEVELRPTATIAKAHLRLWADATATTDVEHVSLFPADTYRGDVNGLRRDLAEALEQMHPGVFRFPGGCIVEGTDLATRYQWKNTIGPVENRPLNENRWHYCFRHRYFPNYYQSYGLGFYEFFRLSEQIGAAPLPVLNVGMSCQYQNSIDDEARVHVAPDDLAPYIQDCIDLIDFANADPSTNDWARRRAEMGHPAPFGLKYIAIGNEQWDYDGNPAYSRRLARFIEALRATHPEIRIIGSTGPQSEGKEFDQLQRSMTSLGCDLYDEHYYRNEAWFTDSINRHRYDHYDRSQKAPRVFAGEYACHGDGKKYNHFNAALMEAQFMTGLERNADVVHMATYAPLFAHAEGWQWRPDAIWFDNLRCAPSASYYVQQLYATYRGDRVLPLSLEGKAVAGDADQHGLSATASLDATGHRVIVKVANIGDTDQPVDLTLKGLRRGTALKSAEAIVLHSDNPDADNTLDVPDRIKPVHTPLPAAGNSLSVSVPAKSFVVYLLDF